MNTTSTKRYVNPDHKGRIRLLKNWLNVTYEEIAKDTSIKAATLRQISVGYLSISPKTADAICKKYRQINRDWLLDGEGTMLNKETASPLPSIQKTDDLSDWNPSQLKTLLHEKEKLIQEKEKRIEALEQLNDSLKYKIDTLENDNIKLKTMLVQKGADGLEKESLLGMMEH